MWTAIAVAQAILVATQIVLLLRDRSDQDSLVTIMKSQVVLRFEHQGTEGYYEKRQEVVANCDGVTGMTETALRPEYGEFQLLRVTPASNWKSHTIRPQDPPLDIRFNIPPKRGEHFERVISGVFKNSFPGSTEWFDISVTRIIEEISIKVIAPSDRRFVAIGVEQLDTLRGARSDLPEDSYSVVHEGRMYSSVMLRLTRPRIGFRYRIHWTW